MRLHLLSTIVINLSKTHNTENCESELIKMLTDLFNDTMDANIKISRLEQEHGIPISDEMEREVNYMTTYAMGILERGKTEGRAEGKAEGRAEMINIILRLKTSKNLKETVEQLKAEGINSETIEMALKCL